MPVYSFDIRNSKDFYRKLQEDYQEFEVDFTSSRKAINCAMTAWHLIDWIYHESEHVKYEYLSDFQRHLKNECPSLQIMQDITNGTKHHTLERHNPKVEETEFHKGAFSSGFSKGFNISRLVVIMKNGEKRYFDLELENVFRFWEKFFNNFNT